MDKKTKKRIDQSWVGGGSNIFSSGWMGKPSKLAIKAKKDKSGRKTLQLVKINELLGFATRRKK